jgi:hypothetical protein
MKISTKKLRKLIQEELFYREFYRDTSVIKEDKHAEDKMIISALQDTWDKVRMEVGISRPTAEDKSDEALSMIQTYYPRESDILHSRSNIEIDEILMKAFGGAPGDGYHS